MKKYLLHITILILISASGCSDTKRTNWFETFNRNSKDPYGYYIAYHHLDEIYPATKVKSGRKVMSQIEKTLKSNSYDNRGNIIIVVAKQFYLDSMELEKTLEFVNKGNGILILSESYSQNVYDFFKLKNKTEEDSVRFWMENDTLKNQTIHLWFNSTIYKYQFHGYPMNSIFEMNTGFEDTYSQLGYTDSLKHANLMSYYNNNGVFMIHKSPLVFTNHFLLQKENRGYYEQLLSYFNEYPTSVTWYCYVSKDESEETEEMNFNFLFKSPQLLYAFLILLGLMLLYIFFAAKRKQKIIPLMQSNTNSSLEFVETVGMVYYNKKNNKKLSEKMIQYYLESIRTKYNLKTNKLDEAFAKMLSIKTNQSLENTNSFVAYVNYIRSSEDVLDNDIKHLYTLFKQFN